VNRVVIIASRRDAHACVVAKRLEELDAQGVILDSAEYPSKWQLTVQISNGEAPRFVLQTEGVEVDEATLSGVYLSLRAPTSQAMQKSVAKPCFSASC
jgi:hypothetical protein